MFQCDAVWVNLCASLHQFDQPLLDVLDPQVRIARWQFSQAPDETSDLEVPIQILRGYLSRQTHPPHLFGHGTGGMVALFVARRYPELVRSLTLLGVGAQSGCDWIAYYYSQLQTLQQSQRQLLARLVQDLFGPQNQAGTQYLMKMLKTALMVSPSPHSVLRTVSCEPAGVPVPFLACGSLNDQVVGPRMLYQWLPWQKMCDRIWHCSYGRHFFHHAYPDADGEQILDFWHACQDEVIPSTAKKSFSNLKI